MAFFCLRWHLVFILNMNNSRAGSDVRGSSDILSIEGQLNGLTLQTECDDVHQATNLDEASSKEQFQNVIGHHVSQRFAGLNYEGIVESYDNASEMFKVLYTNGHLEEMKWEDLVKYLEPHGQPVHPYPNELPNMFFRNEETGEGLAKIASALPPCKRRRTKGMSSGTKGKEVADNKRPPRQAGTQRRLERSTRNHQTSEMMKLQCSTRNDETSEMMELQHSARYDETSGMMKLRRSKRKAETLAMMKSQLSTGNDETSGMMKLRRSTRKTETSAMMKIQRSTGNDETSEMMKPRRSARYGETSGMMKLRRSTRKTETSEMMKLRRSTRKRKRVVFSYCEETIDKDDDDDPSYPLPPIIQVPWADGGDDDSDGAATRGLWIPKDIRDGRHRKKHWVSLRISASSYPSGGQKTAPDESEDQGTGKQ